MTLTEGKTALCGKLNIEYATIATNGLFSDADLQSYIDFAILRIWDYRPWDFTEGAKSTTTISTEYYDYPDELALGSANYLMISGKSFRKVQFKDYLAYKENYPTGTDKIWSEFNGFIFVNQLAYTVGATMDIFGKKKAAKITAGSELLPFSPVADNNEYSGNEAIILLAYANALNSEKKNNPAQAQIEEKQAYFILDMLWKPFADSKSYQQSDTQYFDVPDFFAQGGSGVNNLGKF